MRENKIIVYRQFKLVFLIKRIYLYVYNITN